MDELVWMDRYLITSQSDIDVDQIVEACFELARSPLLMVESLKRFKH
jgi:hypothetical protein